MDEPKKSRLARARDLVTVEPLLGCYILPAVVASLAVQNMTIELACRVNLALAPATCDGLLRPSQPANGSHAELEAQALVAGMIPWKTPLQSAVPAALVLFVGSYSDRHRRRKPFLLAPLVGEIVSTAALMLCASHLASWPMEAAGVSEALFPALFGGSTTMMMAVYAYVADVSSVETRTVRIGAVHLVSAVLFPVGSALSGILFETIGYHGVYSVSIVLYAFALCYGLFRVKEPRQPVHVGKSFCADFFDPGHIKDTFSIVYKKREGSKRARIILLMLVFIVIIGPSYGEAVLAYLYTRAKFKWDAVQFSLYLTYDVIIHFIGSTFAITVLSHRLKLDDLLLAALACACKVAASFMYAFSGTPTLFYLAPVVSIMSGAGAIAMRSIATKIVAADELGKVQSLFGICEAVAPIIYTAVYSRVYIATIKTLPGAFFLLGAALICPSILIFLGMYFLQRSDQKKAAAEKLKGKDNEVFKYTLPISEL